MPLCTHRVSLPGSPSTCTLDTVIVPLPSFCLVVVFLLFFFKIRKPHENSIRLPYPNWLHTVYFILVIAAFAMSILEIARLVAQVLGVGLLPMTPIALCLILPVLWIERRGRTRAMSSIFCAYWIFLASVETVKVVRLGVLDDKIPGKSMSPDYPASDQLLDNAVMCGLFWLFFVFELYTAIRMRGEVDKSKAFVLRGLR